MHFLSDDEKRRFAEEMVATVRACAAVHQFEPLAIAVDAWKSTAEAYAAGVPRQGEDLQWLDEPVAVVRPTA